MVQRGRRKIRADNKESILNDVMNIYKLFITNMMHSILLSNTKHSLHNEQSNIDNIIYIHSVRNKIYNVSET